MLRTYVPFAVEGFARTSALMSARAFSASAPSANETLPTRAWTMPAFSTRYSILPPLASRDGVPDVERDRADLGVRHEAARTEDATELTDGAHHVGRRDDAIEVHEAFRHLRDHVVAAGEVGAGRLGLRFLLALGEDEDANRLTGAVRKDERAADHLVGVLGIDSQANGEVHRLVELGELRLLDEGARLFDRVFARTRRRFRRPSCGSWTTSASSSFSAFLDFVLRRLVGPPTVGPASSRTVVLRSLSQTVARTIRGTKTHVIARAEPLD